MAEITINIKSDNDLQATRAKNNLQKLADRLNASGVNKLMEMYDNPLKKMVVETFFKSNGI